FPGALAIALGIAGFAIALRRRREHGETALIYGSLAGLAFWASFGPRAGLYRALYELPVFGFLRAPSRMGLVVVLSLAVFASIALARLLQLFDERRGTLAALVAGAVAVAELTLIPIKAWSRAPVLPAPYADLARSPRGVVAEFPFYGERIAFP